jgi:hypothetical protein
MSNSFSVDPPVRSAKEKVPPQIQKEYILNKLQKLENEDLKQIQNLGTMKPEEMEKLLDKFVAIVHALNTHQEIHFDLLEIINSELQNRPTFKQTFECFKECVHTEKEVKVIEMARQMELEKYNP